MGPATQLSVTVCALAVDIGVGAEFDIGAPSDVGVDVGAGVGTGKSWCEVDTSEGLSWSACFGGVCAMYGDWVCERSRFKARFRVCDCGCGCCGCGCGWGSGSATPCWPRAGGGVCALLDFVDLGVRLCGW